MSETPQEQQHMAKAGIITGTTWQVECICGFITAPSENLPIVNAEFTAHLGNYPARFILEGQLERIGEVAAFLVGNGDVCEIAAKRLRAVLREIDEQGGN